MTPETSNRAEEVEVLWVTIPMPDGVRLHATLYLPPGEGEPHPALLTLTPYLAQSFHPIGLCFAGQGYPFLVVDVRGRGNSEGVFAPLRDGADGREIVGWLAGQPFCDGRVAMWGGSYGGFAQWVTAAAEPPALAAIAPTASPCMGVDFPMRSNVVGVFPAQWLLLVAGRTLQDRWLGGQDRVWAERLRRFAQSGRPFRELGEVLRAPRGLFEEWIDHPMAGPYWDAYNPAPEQYARIDAPVLTVTGHYDDDQPGALAHYVRHLQGRPGARHNLVIGPWDHAGTAEPRSEFLGVRVGPNALVDLKRLHLDWYDWVLKEGPRPRLLGPPVAYYVMGADTWRGAESLEAVTERELDLFLHAVRNPDDVFHAGELRQERPPEASPASYVHDPADVSLAAVEVEVPLDHKTDQRLLLAQTGAILVYHSAPFPEGLEVAGFFRLTLWLGIDRPDTDIQAQVFAVTPDGRSLQLTADVMRARHREGLRSERLVSSPEPLAYALQNFTFVAYALEPGSRLRLTVGPLNSIYSQRNYGGGGVVAQESADAARPVTVRLFHGGVAASALHVPLGAANPVLDLSKIEGDAP